MFRVVPYAEYGAVYQEDDESLDQQEMGDYIDAVLDAVNNGDLDPDEARVMVEHEKNLNSVR